MATHRLSVNTKYLRMARAQYESGAEAQSAQLLREQEDISFEDGNQWPADLLTSRQAQTANPQNGMPAAPQRPSLVINKIREPIRNTLNQARAADLGIQLVPADDFGDLGIVPDKEEIALREGLVRRIQRESHAQDARMWAFKRALIAGRGYYFVFVEYLDGPTFDQRVLVERIYHQESVVGDPSRQKPSGKDSRFWFIGTWVPWADFAKRYPEDVNGIKNPFTDATESDFVQQAEAYPKWYSGKDSKEAMRAVRVVAHWYVEETFEDFVLLNNGETAWKKDLKKRDHGNIARERRVPRRKIKFARIAGGVMVVEQTDWASDLMPIMQVLGDEILPYDDEKRAEGMVRPARSSQQGENYMISKFVETVGLTPISPLQVDPIAIAGYEEWYKQAATRAWPYLPSRTYDDEGRELQQPHRPAVDANILPMAQGIAMFDQFIRSTTHVPDAALGNVEPSLKSARAVNAVVSQANISTAGYVDNLVSTVTYEAEVINSLLYPIYGTRPGRLLRILTGEGKAEGRVIGQPKDAGSAQQSADAANMKIAAGAKLTKDARFDVAIKIVKNSEARRAQFVQMFGQILGAEPNQMAVGGDLFYQNMDIPEAPELAERQRLMLAPPIQQFLAKRAQGEKVDPATMAEIAQLTERLQMAERAMHQEHQAAEGNVLDYQKATHVESLRQIGSYDRDMLAAALKVKLATIESARAIRVAELNNQAKIGIAKDANLVETIALDRGQAHDVAMQALDAAEAEATRTHDAAMATLTAAAQQQTQPAAGADAPPSGAPSGSAGQ